MKKMRTLSLPRQVLQAAVVPDSLNVEQRTVDVIWSTGQRIRFWDWDIGEYDLTLGLGRKNVRLDFARQGAPVLDSHGHYGGVKTVQGVVEKIDVDGKQGTATLRFSKRADVEPIYQDIADGILRFVSVGTQLHEVDDVTEDGDPVPHYFASDHEPLEISLAAIPRDTGAVMQSKDEEQGTDRFPCVVRYSADAAQMENDPMKPKGKGTAADQAAHDRNEPDPQGTPETANQSKGASASSPGTPDPEPRPAAAETAPDSRNVAEQATRAERERVREIRRVAQHARLADDYVEQAIERGITVEQVRDHALQSMFDSDNAAGVHSHVTMGRSEGDTLRDGVTELLLHRVRPASFALKGAGRDFVGFSLLELARRFVEEKGIRTGGMPRMKVAQQAFQSTSDFPLLLENIATKTLRMGYEEAPRTFTPFCRQATLSDFKQVSRAQIGAAPAFLAVNEGGEFQYGSLGEGAEKYALGTYGRIIPFTRQAIVNDDLDAFSRVIPMMGAAAARLESNVVYAIMTGNPNMADGNPLFDATNHSNQAAAAAAVSPTTLGAARASIRRQTGLAGEILNLSPSFIIAPATIETVVQQVLTQITPDAFGNVNPFAGTLTAIIEPRLDEVSTANWYVACNPSQVDTIEFAYLEGESGPVIESEVGFDVDGMKIKGRHDFAAKAIDWRGLYRNSTP